MSRFTTPKGTRDFPPDIMAKRNVIKEIVVRTFENYGYQELTTPTFEEFNLFAERSGEEIREKMFTFIMGEKEYALRPEVTAAICRMVSENVIIGPKPYKLYYICPCFRYEQPQAGRYREFWQAGIELIGKVSLLGDAEVIMVAVKTLQNCGIEKYKLKIGNIGILRNLFYENDVDFDLQNKIIGDIDKIMSVKEKCEAIKSKIKIEKDDISYIQIKIEELYNLHQTLEYSGDFQIALTQEFNDKVVKKWLDLLPEYTSETIKYIWINEYNIKEKLVEILFAVISLSGKKQDIVEKADTLLKGTTSEKPLNDLLQICDFLELFGVHDYEMVLGVARGLDYYTDVVFEIDCPLLGAQKQICGGGRYDNLVSDFHGPDTPGLGFSIGFDRLIEAVEKTREIEDHGKIDVFVATVTKTVDKDIRCKVIEIAESLRKFGKRVGIDLVGLDLREQLGYAKKLGAEKVLIIGPDELEQEEVTIRDMQEETQKRIKISSLSEFFSPTE